MIINKKVRLNDFLSCLEPSITVSIFIYNPDDCSIEHFIESEVKFISLKSIGSYFVQSVFFVNDPSVSDHGLNINVMPDDCPFGGD